MCYGWACATHRLVVWDAAVEQRFDGTGICEELRISEGDPLINQRLILWRRAEKGGVFSLSGHCKGAKVSLGSYGQLPSDNKN